ncbi:MAG: tetratricopeptide repeat protein [Melioribacteraceae bacterium]|nr:tetratricopeptide repeat protein [Melioribacteraceae bacterium]MCF8353085.1 tetratricopeptide repeat protein [Melioribacteraceae bacterium]MCF8392769.1 tetratricopeptide repeat protein [Melioribacteraceae bacterium]MCF8418300.1 tetratricopeptide repeat protein [Melioribacteraceae bacterium]
MLDEKLKIKFEEAESFEKANQHLHAIQIYSQLLEEPSYKRKVTIKLASIYERVDRIDSSINVLENYVNQFNDDNDVKKLYAHFLLRYKYYEKALGLLRTISIKENCDIDFLLGLANFNLGDHEIAIINFKDFIDRNPKSELLNEANLYLAKSYAETKNLDAALEYAKQSEKIFEANYEVHHLKAVVYYLKQMYYNAFDSILRAIKLNAAEPPLHFWAGKILMKVGEFNKAEQHFNDYLQLGQPIAELYSLMGLIKLNQKMQDEAEKYFESALKLNPNEPVALERKLKAEKK